MPFAEGHSKDTRMDIKQRESDIKLGYPKHWLIKEFALAVMKGLTPYRVQLVYRQLRKKGT